MKQQLRGIALILFGVLIAFIGLVMVFVPYAEKK